MGYQNLLVETRDGITFVTVNRPDKLNALNDRTVEELDAAFAALAADPGTRGVILTGAGEKAFVAGADIAELATQSPVDGKERSVRGQRVLDRIERLGKPVVAAVNGFALGGGCELAMACHVRVAAATAKLGTPEVKLGIMCGYAGTQRLPRILVLRSSFNADVVDGLLAGARQALRAMGARPQDVTVVDVPGAFELPLAAAAGARSRRFDAIVALGVVIRGETDHYEHIAREA